MRWICKGTLQQMCQSWRSKGHMLLSLLTLSVVHHPGTFFQHQQGIIDQSSPFRHGSAMHLSLKIPFRACKIHDTQQTLQGLRGICILNTFAWKKMQLQDAMRPRRGLGQKDDRSQNQQLTKLKFETNFATTIEPQGNIFQALQATNLLRLHFTQTNKVLALPHSAPYTQRSATQTPWRWCHAARQDFDRAPDLHQMNGLEISCKLVHWYPTNLAARRWSYNHFCRW